MAVSKEVACTMFFGMDEKAFGYSTKGSGSSDIFDIFIFEMFD